MKLLNLWATSYRNARALAAAGVMLLAILSMLSLRCNPLTGRENIQGLVLEIEATGLASPLVEGPPHARVLVAVVDSTQVRIMLPPPVPRPGHFIPLIAEHFKKGNTDYFLDKEKWLIEGPQ